jgi:hypothetical protein
VNQRRGKENIIGPDGNLEQKHSALSIEEMGSLECEKVRWLLQRSSYVVLGGSTADVVEDGLQLFGAEQIWGEPVSLLGSSKSVLDDFEECGDVLFQRLKVRNDISRLESGLFEKIIGGTGEDVVVIQTNGGRCSEVLH